MSNKYTMEQAHRDYRQWAENQRRKGEVQRIDSIESVYGPSEGRFEVAVNGRTIPVDMPAVMPSVYRIVVNDTHTRAWIEEAL